MRNKTLLIRRHLIHYWHLSNQTTFHKTLFSHSDDEDRKIRAWKICFVVGKFSPRSRSRAFKHQPTTTFQQEQILQHIVVTACKCLEFYAENCSESREGNLFRISTKRFFPTQIFKLSERRTWNKPQSTREKFVDRRTHSPPNVYGAYFQRMLLHYIFVH